VITVRPADLDDVEHMMPFVYELKNESPYYCKIEVSIDKIIDCLISCVMRDDFILAVAEDSDNCIIGGLAGFTNSYWFSDELVAGDFSFFVTKKKRGFFAARKLVKFYVEWAKQKGVKPHNIQMGITTSVNPDRTAMLLKKFGFTSFGEIFVYGGGYGR